MRTNYIISGAAFAAIGLVVLMMSGGLVFWTTGTVDNGDVAGAAVGIPVIIGWALLLIGVAMIIVGAVAEPRYPYTTKTAAASD